MSDGKRRSRGSGFSLARFAYAVGEGFRIASDSLRTNVFRSGLTILGVAIGVSVVVLIASLITGIRGSIQDDLDAAGPRNLYVLRFDVTDVQLIQAGNQRPPWWNRPPISVEETRRIAGLPSVRSAVTSIALQDQQPGAEGGITMEFEGVRIRGIQGLAEGAEWIDYRPVEFVQGRNFHPVEVEEARPIVVITDRLAQALFGDRDPIGLRVRTSAGPAGALPLTVVGVFELGDMLFGEEQFAYTAILPFTTGLRRLGVSDEWSQAVVVPEDGVDLDVAEDQIITLLRNMRGLSPAEENNFSILRSTQLLEFFDRFTAVFFVVMLALSSVGLLVGGVGVVGIMLISVTERTREIGIRKSVGATGGEILWQFLVEAAVLTALGGAGGLLIGAGGSWLVATLTPIPASIPLWSVAAGLTMAVITGMLFGLVPAARAARMEPVAALRHE
jgi:putative ABC transport system permease protein